VKQKHVLFIVGNNSVPIDNLVIKLIELSNVWEVIRSSETKD
jgi:hypothetical protein